MTLLERLEAAEAPSRELFIEVWTFCKPEPPKGNPIAPTWYWEVWKNDTDHFKALLDAEAWTDAALSLVPEGIFRSHIVKPNGNAQICLGAAYLGTHAYEAIAICIAALKVKGIEHDQ